MLPGWIHIACSQGADRHSLLASARPPPVSVPDLLGRPSLRVAAAGEAGQPRAWPRAPCSRSALAHRRAASRAPQRLTAGDGPPTPEFGRGRLRTGQAGPRGPPAPSSSEATLLYLTACAEPGTRLEATSQPGRSGRTASSRRSSEGQGRQGRRARRPTSRSRAVAARRSPESGGARRSPRPSQRHRCPGGRRPAANAAQPCLP